MAAVDLVDVLGGLNQLLQSRPGCAEALPVCDVCSLQDAVVMMMLKFVRRLMSFM